MTAMWKIYRFVLVVSLVAIPSLMSYAHDSAKDSLLNGKYIFVPDSLQADVLKLLMGEGDMERGYNPHETAHPQSWPLRPWIV